MPSTPSPAIQILPAETGHATTCARSPPRRSALGLFSAPTRLIPSDIVYAPIEASDDSANTPRPPGRDKSRLGLRACCTNHLWLASAACRRLTALTPPQHTACANISSSLAPASFGQTWLPRNCSGAQRYVARRRLRGTTRFICSEIFHALPETNDDSRPNVLHNRPSSNSCRSSWCDLLRLCLDACRRQHLWATQTLYLTTTPTLPWKSAWTPTASQLCPARFAHDGIPRSCSSAHGRSARDRQRRIDRRRSTRLLGRP